MTTNDEHFNQITRRTWYQYGKTTTFHTTGVKCIFLINMPLEALIFVHFCGIYCFKSYQIEEILQLVSKAHVEVSNAWCYKQQFPGPGLALH